MANHNHNPPEANESCHAGRATGWGSPRCNPVVSRSNHDMRRTSTPWEVAVRLALDARGRGLPGPGVLSPRSHPSEERARRRSRGVFGPPLPSCGASAGRGAREEDIQVRAAQTLDVEATVEAALEQKELLRGFIAGISLNPSQNRGVITWFDLPASFKFGGGRRDILRAPPAGRDRL